MFAAGINLIIMIIMMMIMIIMMMIMIIMMMIMIIVMIIIIIMIMMNEVDYGGNLPEGHLQHPADDDE